MTSTPSVVEPLQQTMGALDSMRLMTQLGLLVPTLASISRSRRARLPSFPIGFETRLLRVLADLERLELWVPDLYDLAAAKLLRGNEHDRQQLVELHHLVRLDRSTLIERFNLLLANYVGDPLEPRWSLYHLVTEIWGEVASIDLRP